MQVCTGCEYIQVGSVRETSGITGRLLDKLKLQLTVMGKCYLLPYSRPSQYRRSWDCEKLALFRNCGIGREFKLKNPIWDLKWAAVLGGRRYWEGRYWEGRYWEGRYWGDGIWRDGIGRDGIGRDYIGRDGIGRDGIGREAILGGAVLGGTTVLSQNLQAFN